MKAIFSAVFALGLVLANHAGAQKAPSYEVPPAALQKAPPDEAQLQTHGHYRNKAGHEVHAPAKSVSDKIPAGASAKCRDGSYSFSQSRRGTCSHHGGVATWL